MKNIRNSDVGYMGADTSKVFSGKSENLTNIMMYRETADFFASEIRRRLPPRAEPYKLLDVGSFKGELMSDVLARLPEYTFETTAVDVNSEALENNSADFKINSGANNLPFENGSFDIVMVRYVLQWNVFDSQKNILSELERVVKGFIIIEHVGSDSIDTDGWRSKMDDVLDGVEIPVLKMDGYFFSSKDELEQWMRENSISFECLRNRKIDKASNVYIERYALSETESDTLRTILGDKDYFIQTDWVIYPKD